MPDPAQREQVARIRDIRACDMHRGVKWASLTSTPINEQPLKGMTRQQCSDLCLDTPSCSAFELYVGNDPSTGSCNMYDMNTKNRDELIKRDKTRDRVIGFCEHDIETKGSTSYETSRYEHASHCTLLHSVKFAQQPADVLGRLDNKDSASCAQACIDDAECTAFDVFTDKDPASGQCRLYSMRVPWDAMPSSGFVLSDPNRSHVVGVCTRGSKFETIGYETERCPAHCQKSNTASTGSPASAATVTSSP